MGTISKNFSYREFETSDTADRLHICNVICEPEVRDSLKALVLDVLQPLRDKLGTPCKINSGYRCPELNKAVGGVPTSQHQKGEAADTVWEGMKPIEVARAAVRLGLPYDQLIVYPTFVHFSHKLHGDQRRAVLYNQSYKGPKL